MLIKYYCLNPVLVERQILWIVERQILWITASYVNWVTVATLQ